MNNDVTKVGNWLWGLLSPKELEKIMEHSKRTIEPSSKVILNLELTLFELEALKDYGHVPDRRNCFEIVDRVERK